MAAALQGFLEGFLPTVVVHATDISSGQDFLATDLPAPDVAAIITNPPYSLADAFVARALDLMEPARGMIALLLPTDFDHARHRGIILQGCPVYAKKIALTKRIVWFEGPKAAPKGNHSWFVWDWQHRGPVTIEYAFMAPGRRGRL
jgi:hypothetical protein